MAPLPENATARLFIDYTSDRLSHTLMVRLGAGATPASAAIVAPLVAAIFAIRMSNTDAFTAARFSAEGSLFSLPIPFTAVPGTVSIMDPAAYWAEDPQSAFIDLMGRGSATARRVRWEFFTIIRTPTWPASNRYNPGEAAVIDTLRTNWAALIASAPATGQQIVTVGGDIPVVYGYVNVAKNGYWQRKQR